MRPDWENECVSKSALIEWLRPYLHTGEPIPADVLISDIQMMPPTLTPQNEWISVEDRLPQSIINKVLVYCENGYIGYGHYEKYQGEETWYNLESGEPFASWNLENCSPYKVTHWMPLPNPPEREDGDANHD